MIFNTVHIRQRGLQINPFNDLIITFGSSKSNVLTKSIIDDIYERLQPYQTHELRDPLTYFSILQLLSCKEYSTSVSK